MKPIGLGFIVTAFIGLGLWALKIHDAQLKWQLIAEARRDSITVVQQKADSMKAVIIEHDVARKKLEDSLFKRVKILKEIVVESKIKTDSLEVRLALSMPDSLKSAFDSLTRYHRSIEASYNNQLVAMSELDRMALVAVAERDELIAKQRLINENIMKQLNDCIKHNKPSFWKSAAKVLPYVIIAGAVGYAAGS